MNVQAVLTESLRAPSAHNAQPWRITPQADGGYELHYDHLDYLPYDPDDRDAYLAMGAFLETMILAAQRHGLVAVEEHGHRHALVQDGGEAHGAEG